jgi:hypothetical protein
MPNTLALNKLILTVLDNVTANQTSTVQVIPDGPRTIQATIIGIGAVAATIAWYGSNIAANSGGILLATSTLSGTTTDTSGSAITAEWPYMYCTLSGISGTNAAITATVSV